MLMFIVRRVISGAFMVLAITVIAFTLLYLGGGNIARQLLGTNATIVMPEDAPAAKR